jgi:uncharacterized protein
VTESISAVISITNTCNLACQYCYATNRSGKFRKENLMSCETLARIINQIASTGKRYIQFYWHGGEPLLGGKDFFENIIALQKKYKLTQQVFTNTIQTNAVLMTPDLAEFFSNQDFRIGVSLDGPSFLHDGMRKFSSGEGSFSSTMRGIRYLQDKKIPLGFLAVITKQSLDYVNEFFDFFQNNEFSYFDFLPYVEFCHGTKDITSDSITSNEFGEFLIKAYNRWFRSGYPGVKIRFFDNVVASLFGGKPSTCTFIKSCSEQLSFAWNGDVYHCDWFFGQNDKCFGNVNDEKLEQILTKPAYSRYISEIKNGSLDCIKCDWKLICNGGCAYHREILGSFNSLYYFCNSRKMLYSHIRNINT